MLRLSSHSVSFSLVLVSLLCCGSCAAGKTSINPSRDLGVVDADQVVRDTGVADMTTVADAGRDGGSADGSTLDAGRDASVPVDAGSDAIADAASPPTDTGAPDLGAGVPCSGNPLLEWLVDGSTDETYGRFRLVPGGATGASYLSVGTVVNPRPSGSQAVYFTGPGWLESSAVTTSWLMQLQQGMSVEAWVSISLFANDTIRIVGKSTASTDDGFYFGLMNRRPQLAVGGNVITADDRIAWNAMGSNPASQMRTAWTHLVATWQGGATPAMALYANGAAIAGTTIGSPPARVPTNTNTLRIGADSAGGNLSGYVYIDNVRIYCRALSASDVMTRFTDATAR